MMDVLKNKMVTTRKKHFCYMCSRLFENGTVMRSQTNVGDDGIYTVYNCQTCESISKEFPELIIDDGIFWTDCVANALNYDYKQPPRETPEALLYHLRCATIDTM